MTLSNEDKALIKETSDLLKQLKPLLNKVEKFICEPIDTTEGEPIETEQRWEVTVKPFNYNMNDNRITIYLNDGVLLTIEAQKVAEAIKQYLSTNKF
jgi:hypothetical protein